MPGSVLESITENTFRLRHLQRGGGITYVVMTFFFFFLSNKPAVAGDGGKIGLSLAPPCLRVFCLSSNGQEYTIAMLFEYT